MEFLEALSLLFGWVYTACWSLSFYPQPLLNYRRRSTSGTTIDFPFINALGRSRDISPQLSKLTCKGFLAYFVSNLAFYYSPVIRAQYAARHHGLTPTVQFNDIAFAGQGFLLSVITTSQYFPSLWGFPPAAGQRPSRFILGVFLGCVVGVLAVVTIVAARPDEDARTGWAWLDAVYAVSYVKLLITLIKYAPQLVTNWRSKSTKGWSIVQILLDFSGGVLSIAQQGIDSYLQRDWSGIWGNPVKFFLGNVSMMYDVAFITQHYVLYRDSNGKAGEREALLDRSDEERNERRVD
jgi:cystinosin